MAYLTATATFVMPAKAGIQSSGAASGESLLDSGLRRNDEIVDDEASRAMSMKKITLSLDDELLAGARKVATERGTTLEALIREQLVKLVREKPHKEAARQGLLDLMSKSKARLGPDYIWNRNEIYRRFGGPSHADD